MSDISGMRIRVTTQELIVTSGEVETQVSNMRRIFDEVNNIVNRSASYWEAQGQTAYIKAYRSKCDAVETALKNFSSNVTNLRTIAGIYEKVESAAAEEANALSSDVIV